MEREANQPSATRQLEDSVRSSGERMPRSRRVSHIVAERLERFFCERQCRFSVAFEDCQPRLLGMKNTDVIAVATQREQPFRLCEVRARPPSGAPQLAPSKRLGLPSGVALATLFIRIDRTHRIGLS
jgi:hypothetical protein